MTARLRRGLGRTDVVVVIATVVVLLLGMVQRYRVGPAPDAGPFMQSVQRAVAAVVASTEPNGRNSGTFVSAEAKMPRAAYDLLVPNVLMSRRYRDLGTGRQFDVTVVHCGDARDMFAHYPPVCYVGNGYTMTDRVPMPLTMSDGSTLPGVEYRFDFGRPNAQPPLRIWNVLLMADDMRFSDMADIRGRVFTSNARFYGAGQIQLIVSADQPESERRAAYAQGLALYEPVLRAMLATPQSRAATTDR
jgi:hypothetical protein